MEPAVSATAAIPTTASPGTCGDACGDDAPSWIHLRFKSFATASKPHWLHLLANPQAPLCRLDDHLRDTWYFDKSLSSRLAISNETYSRRPNPKEPSDETVDEMTVPMSEVLEPNPEFNYFYAPECSRLMLIGKVYSEGLPRPEPFRKTSPEADVHTLARNEPVPTSCDTCEAPDADYRCFDCYVPRSICENCRGEHPDDHRLYEHKNTPLMGDTGMTLDERFERLEKVRTLAEGGATEGERTAAKRAEEKLQARIDERSYADDPADQVAILDLPAEEVHALVDDAYARILGMSQSDADWPDTRPEIVYPELTANFAAELRLDLPVHP